MVSVIIPAYNAASTIGRAVKSVTDQTFNRLEIIVVNDGSTDDIFEALEPYQVHVVNQSNQGAAAARNHGGRVASGELLAFLDADDFWHPDKLRKQVYAMQKHPTARYCVTDSCKVSSLTQEITNQWSNSIDSFESELIEFPSVFKNPYFGTPGVLMPKALFESTGGFNENLTTAEDVDLWLRAAYGGVVLKIPEILFYIVRTKNSLSGRFLDRTYCDNIIVIDQFCDNYPEFLEEHRDAVNSARARVFCDWGSEALSRGDVPLAKEKLALSIKAKLGFRSLYLFGKTLL
ncbi:MAG: glycosyltransferase family A protein [Ekhidna sp.]